MDDHKEKCPKCGSWVKGVPNRGFIRDIVHDAPAMGIDNIPIGGKFLGQGLREVSKRWFKTDIDKIGDEVEKCVYKDIRIEFCCPNPDCGEKWEKTYQLEESEYTQLIADWVEKTKDMTTLKVKTPQFKKLFK